MNLKLIAGIVIISVASVESSEAADFDLNGDHTLHFGSVSETTFSNPHVHNELKTDVIPTTASPFSTSGGGSSEAYRLFVYPTPNGFKLVGHPMPAAPDNREPQAMYGLFSNPDALAQRLAEDLDLPLPQVAAIRANAIAGAVQGVGGHYAMRLFERAELERLGLTFRPIEN